MISKKNRLRRNEIEDLKIGKKEFLHGNFFSLIFQGQPGIRKFGLIISNKISRKATARNRIKRTVYRILKKRWMGPEGKYLFLAKKNSLEANCKEVEQEIEEFERKIVSLKKEVK